MDKKRFEELAMKSAKTSADFFKHNLNAIMKEKKINRVELAKKMDMPYTTLCDWCTGRIYPKREKIEMIAKALEVQYKDLDGIRWRDDIDDDVSNELASATVAEQIPAGKTPRESCNLYPWFETTLSPNLLKHDSYFFGLRSNDESMEPKLTKDDYVVCQQGNLIDRDGLYVVRKKNEDAIIRYIMMLNDGFAVITLNTPLGAITESYKYDDIDKKIEILGMCVEYTTTAKYK